MKIKINVNGMRQLLLHESMEYGVEERIDRVRKTKERIEQY